MLVVLYPIRKFSYQLVIVNRSYLAAVCHGKELHGIGRVQGFDSHPIVFVCVCVCGRVGRWCGLVQGVCVGVAW